MEDKQSKKIKAAFYIRKSTEEQSQYSLEFQKDRLEAAAIANDYEVQKEHIFVDDGFSGVLGISERPLLKEMFEAAERREFQLILVYRLDRFFRKTSLLLDAVDRLGKLGVALKSVTEPFDTSNAFGQYLLTNLGAIAELERETIKERTQGGRIKAMKAGIWVGSGTPAFGYKFNKDTKKLEVEPDEAKWIKKFFEWFVYERMTLRQLQKRVNSTDIPTKWDRIGRDKRISRKSFWQKRTLGRILTNEIYTGTFYYYKFKKAGYGDVVKNNKRPKEEWVEVKTPVIISEELFNSAGKQLERNRLLAARKTLREYLYSGLLVCGKCGYRMFAAFSPPKINSPSSRAIGSKYYRGAWVLGHTDQPRCKSCGCYSETRLEPVWTTLVNLLKRPTSTIDMLNKYNDWKSNKTEKEIKIEEINGRLNAIELKRSKLFNLYLEENALDETTYKSHILKCDIEEEKLKTEKAQIVQSLISKSETKNRAKSIAKIYKKLKTRLDNCDYRERRTTIRLLIEKITLNSRMATVEFNLPVTYSPNVLWDNCRSSIISKSPNSYVLRDNYRSG